MEQVVKQPTTETPRKVDRAFAPRTARRLESINEDALNAILDDFDADQKIADAMEYIDANEPKDKRPFAEFIEEYEQKS